MLLAGVGDWEFCMRWLCIVSLYVYFCWLRFLLFPVWIGVFFVGVLDFGLFVLC